MKNKIEIITPRGIVKVKSIEQYILLNILVYGLTFLFMSLVIYLTK